MDDEKTQRKSLLMLSSPESVRQSDGWGRGEEFLTCVSHTAHVIAIGWMSVRPSVCLSVTHWYCVETAQPIVKLHLHCLVAP